MVRSSHGILTDPLYSFRQTARRVSFLQGISKRFPRNWFGLLFIDEFDNPVDQCRNPAQYKKQDLCQTDPERHFFTPESKRVFIPRLKAKISVSLQRRTQATHHVISFLFIALIVHRAQGASCPSRKALFHSASSASTTCSDLFPDEVEMSMTFLFKDLNSYSTPQKQWPIKTLPEVARRRFFARWILMIGFWQSGQMRSLIRFTSFRHNSSFAGTIHG
jgi:hypothetical protein